MKRFALMILVVIFLGVLVYPGTIRSSFGAEIVSPATETYVVKDGDTLSGIAKERLGDYGRWREIWQLNKETIANPDMIYVGQKIKIASGARSSARVIKSLPTRQEVKGRIIRLMFKARGIEYEPASTIHERINRRLSLIGVEGIYFTQRKLLMETYQDLLILELFDLADSIIETAYTRKNPIEWAAMLTAVAWQESHFYNRRGAAGEISHFQLLPKTLKIIYDNAHFNDSWLEFRAFLSMVESRPNCATKIAVDMLAERRLVHGSWEKALLYYNGYQVGNKYPAFVMKKFRQVQNIILQ